ncbi:MAG: PaRep2b protein, partial [Thermoproteus sp.]
WGEVVDAVKERLRDVEVGPRLDLAKALEELEKLRSRLADDKIAREAVAPALLLIQAEKLGVNEESLRYFAMVISGAIGGDGYVSAAGRGKVGLASGELAIALLWGAAFRAHGIKAEVRRAGTAFQVVASGGGAVKLARLYFLFGPPLLEGDKRLKNNKLDEAVGLGAKEALNVGWERLRETEGGRVAADLTISEGNVEVKYNVYLRRDAIVLEFISTDRGRAELATHLLRLAGVSAEVKGKGSRDEWRVEATTDRLAAGRRELRDAIADIVREALVKGWVNKEIADRWLDKLERGRVLREGWPKYLVRLTRNGALVVQYSSTNPGNLEHEAQRFRDLGLVEGRHFTVRMPEGGGKGYVRILKKGLAYAVWLSIHGSGDQQRLAAEFVDLILERARKKGGAVYEKALEIVRRGKAVGSLRLADVRGAEVFVGGRRYVVDVLGGGAEFGKGRSGKTLLRITITAEVDGVKSDYEVAFGRYGAKNEARGFAAARANAPGGKEADAERFAALVEALTGEEPRIYRRSDGKIDIVCGREHLDGFARYAELAEAIEKWLEETGRR